MYTMFDQAPPLVPFQFFFCPHHHSSLPTPCVLFFLLNPQSPLGPLVCVCVWLIEKIRERILMSQRLKFKRLLCQTEMNHFSFFKSACIFIYVRVYIFVQTYLFMCMHVCQGQRLASSIFLDHSPPDILRQGL